MSKSTILSYAKIAVGLIW